MAECCQKPHWESVRDAMALSKGDKSFKDNIAWPPRWVGIVLTQEVENLRTRISDLESELALAKIKIKGRDGMAHGFQSLALRLAKEKKRADEAEELREKDIQANLISYRKEVNLREAAEKLNADLKSENDRLTVTLTGQEKCTDDFAEQVARKDEALRKIARSAPCKDGHESFNSPGQLCDQRIAEAALSPSSSWLAEQKAKAWEEAARICKEPGDNLFWETFEARAAALRASAQKGGSDK